METPLKFAPLIRVSTEKQKVKGESLKTQLAQIRQYVELLKGTIPEHCLIYQGQEHSTPGFERALLDRLLADSSKGLFDAVIVTDASRWSRDNQKSEAGLNQLAENGIRFFVSMMEFDLHNPEHRFILGMNTQINQLQASKQSINSITNRIARAKRNINSAGKLPFGRTFDKTTGLWGVDEDKKKLIEDAAIRYLNGEPIPQIARTFHMNPSNLYTILTKMSGPVKSFRFKYKRIDETVTITIPALLDEATINAIHERIYINTTNRGHIKNKYLLSGFTYCSKCGYKLEAWTNVNGVHYYKHSHRTKVRCFNKFVSAPEIETAVLIEIIRTFGDWELIEKAIKRASPDMSKVESLTKEKDNIDIELKKITTQKNNIVSKIADELITDEEADDILKRLREQEKSFKERLSIINSELSNTPDPDHIKRLSKWTGKVIASVTKGDSKAIFTKSFEWKRKLIERTFSGVNSSGQHLGVYINRVDDKFIYEIKGLFEGTVKSLPLTDDDLIEAFKIDPEYQDISKEIKNIREKIGLNMESRHHSKPFREIFVASYI